MREQHQRAADEHKKEKKAKAAERVAAKAKKQQKHEAATLHLAIGQILSNKKLHVFRIQLQLNVVEVQLLQVVRLLNLCCHLLPPKPQRASRTIKLPDKFK
jgi:hypothetical protein